MADTAWRPNPDRCFASEPRQRELARELYEGVRELPLVCPHGHVPPELLADPEARFPDPAALFVVPDHYIFRMLYSQGVPLEDLGVPTRDGTPVETDPRKIWQTFADHIHLFRGTPTGLWLAAELHDLFGVEEKLTSESAQRIYDAVQTELESDAFRPRALFERFGIETLATTDAASDSLEPHRRAREAGVPLRPTFRPDAAFAIGAPGWRDELTRLGAAVGVEIVDYGEFVAALEQRREAFRAAGATATDHAALTPEIVGLPESDASAIFERALAGEASATDAARFTGHMLMEMARMSAADGLVMQLHVGSLRDHNRDVFARFGLDKGGDIPVAVDWTRGLRELLNRHGTDPAFRLVVYTLDESTYARELAPLAGHYPALRLGAPWWFFDSVLGMERYLDRVVETAGIYNLAGFNDDTRAFPSIPARHDVWRRVSCNWLAGMARRGLIDRGDASEMARALAYDQAKATYRLP